MNVQEFTEKEIERLILFREYWQKENAKDADMFVSEQEEIDWIEHFNFYVDKQ